MADTKRITIDLPKAIYKEMLEVKEEEGRTMTYHVIEACEKYTKSKKRGKK